MKKKNKIDYIKVSAKVVEETRLVPVKKGLVEMAGLFTECIIDTDKGPLQITLDDQARRKPGDIIEVYYDHNNKIFLNDPNEKDDINVFGLLFTAVILVFIFYVIIICLSDNKIIQYIGWGLFNSVFIVIGIAVIIGELSDHFKFRSSTAIKLKAKIIGLAEKKYKYDNISQEPKDRNKILLSRQEIYSTYEMSSDSYDTRKLIYYSPIYSYVFNGEEKKYYSCQNYKRQYIEHKKINIGREVELLYDTKDNSVRIPLEMGKTGISTLGLMFLIMGLLSMILMIDNII